MKVSFALSLSETKIWNQKQNQKQYSKYEEE